MKNEENKVVGTSRRDVRADGSMRRLKARVGDEVTSLKLHPRFERQIKDSLRRLLLFNRHFLFHSEENFVQY